MMCLHKSQNSKDFKGLHKDIQVKPMASCKKTLSLKSSAVSLLSAFSRPLFLGVACVVGAYSPCAALTSLDPGRVIEFKISKSGMTRISIDNDSIEDVYAYPAEPDLINHHKSGHVFVTPDDLEIPVYLTVITRRGLAQDLRLTPAAKKAEPILLHVEEPRPSSASTSGASSQETYAALLAQFIKGVVPPGFQRSEAPESSRGISPLEAILDHCYVSSTLRVLVFTIKNDSSDKHTLDNKVFWGKGDLASAFDRPTLDSQETARFFIVQHL